jgi:predicted O-methyltransferase YrrM
MAHPHRLWSLLQRCAQLARHAELPVAELLRYRRELRNDLPFQEHLVRHRREIAYILPEASELYVIMRAFQPRVVVETGVASGLSSAHILRALAANGHGALYSIDLPNVQEGSVLPSGRSPGWIVPEWLRERWFLELGDSRELLPPLLERLDQIDIFLHDSDHSYEFMMFEFELALPRVRPGGLLLSDDTHLHSAWDDFCASHGLCPGRLGHLGITRKSAVNNTSSTMHHS